MNAPVQTLSTAKRALTGAQVGVPPRHVSFTYPHDAARYCFYDGNPLASLLFVVFSGIFPPGERFFMDTVRHFRERVSDPVLKAQVAGFMGQEALHGREHDRLNDFFRARGIDVATPERLVQWGLDQLRRLPPRQQLACTCAMEHFTAHLAEAWLTDDLFRRQADPRMLQLWSWHALEEMEHKSVAFDVFEQVGGTVHERRLAMLLILAVMAPPIFASWIALIARERQLFNVRANRRGLRVLFGRQGFISQLMKHMPAFARRDFHPREQETAGLETIWREKLFGLQGELREAFTNREAMA